MNRSARHTLSSTLDKIAAYFGLVLTKVPDVREAIVLDVQEMGEVPHLQCPHCLVLDDIAEIDRSTRRNELFDLDYGLDGRSGDLIIGVSEDDHNYVADHVECSSCGGYVTIPARVEVSWG